MTQALNLSPNIPMGTILYRGIGGNYSDELSRDFIDYGFTSFTLKENIARTFLNRRLTIDKDVKGVYLDHGKNLSYYDESEVIIGPRTKYKIVNFEKSLGISYFDIVITKDYNEYETNFRYEELDFVPQFFNMIRYFQSNPNDAFLIGDLIYFFMSMSKNTDKYLYSQHFPQSVEISELLSDDKYLDTENFMSYVLKQDVQCFYLIGSILSGKSLYLVKNGKLFINHTFDNYDEYLDSDEISMTDKIYSQEPFSFLSDTGDKIDVWVENIPYPDGCEIEW